MSHRVVVMREATIRIVKMLADKEVKVTQRGAKAFVEYDRSGRPSRVNIPYVPDDAGDELMDAIQGFIDHEVAHILFSDYAAIKEADKLGLSMLHNMVEDSFIERKMAAHFPGSGSNLKNVGEFYLKTYVEPDFKKHPDNAEGVLFVPAIRAWAGQTVFADYMKDKWDHMASVMTALGDAVDKVAECNTSRDCLNIAKQFNELLSAARPKPEESEEESEGDDGSSVGDGSDSKPDDTEDEDDDRTREPSDDKKPDDKSDDEKPDDKSDDEKPDDKKPDEKPDDSDSEDKGDDAPLGTSGEDSSSDDVVGGDEEDGEDSGASPSSHADSEDHPKDPGPSLLDELKEKISKSYDEAVADALTDASVDASKSADYLVYTTEFDVVEPLSLKEHSSRWDDSYLKLMTDQVDHMTGPLQKDLERIMAARSAATWSTGHRSGRLHQPALARLTLFNDDRVFRRKHICDSKDVAVELVIDCSGSMSGSRIKTAAYAAYGLSSVLDRMMIPNEVIGFTTLGRLPAEMKAEEARLGIRYARYQSLYLPIIKGFNERMNGESKKRFASLPTADWLSENVDGESVQIAASRLAQRRESRKILMVLSDGEPACPGDNGQLNSHLKKVVKQIEASRIDVLAIGIGTTAPQRFYSKNVVLNDVSELPTTVIGEIKKLLLK